LYAHHPDLYEAFILAQVQQMNPEALRHALQSPEPDRSSDLIAVIEPSPSSRLSCEKRVASQHVFRMLWDRHIKHRVSDARFYYDFFRGSQNTDSTAGSIFQLRVHELLRRGGFLRLFPIRGHRTTVDFVYNDYTASEEERDQRDLQLPGSGEYHFVEGDQFCVGQCFIDHPDADAGNSPPILLTFHITRNKEYNLNGEDLRRINGLNLPPHTSICKYFVVITPDDIQPEIKVPKALFEGEEQTEGEAPEDLFSMFHYPVSMEELFL